jgi:hypothetical protein
MGRIAATTMNARARRPSRPRTITFRHTEFRVCYEPSLTANKRGTPLRQPAQGPRKTIIRRRGDRTHPLPAAVDLVALGLAVLVEPDQRPGDVEVHLHRVRVLVGDERVGLARRLVDEVARGRSTAAAS